MQYKFSLPLLLTLSALFALAAAQFSPTWQRSPYVEAKTTVIVSNGEKTSGTYTFSLTFIGAFTTPKIVLGTSAPIQPSRNCG
jgi:hypothetical protein